MRRIVRHYPYEEVLINIYQGTPNEGRHEPADPPNRRRTAEHCVPDLGGEHLRRVEVDHPEGGRQEKPSDQYDG